MLSENWVVYLSLLFVVVNKLLQYTTRYHEKWASHFALPNVRAAGRRYQRTLSEHQKLVSVNRSISAQDDYARWTKNNRKLTLLEKELQSLKEELGRASAQNKQLLGRLRLLSLTLPFLALKLWKGKHVVYYLPRAELFPKVVSGVWSQGWFYVALLPLRLLKRQSIGAASVTDVGVSLGIWLWALQRVIDTFEFLIKQLLLAPVVLHPPSSGGKENGAKHEITSDRIDLD
ncbi:hypothetical protein HG536_0D04530 [Torulaspora globosa]|uniref:Golgi to ER traffic protein 1 n=1 Tax=Torulaspora globosa TaxID=48254 RepID=A0A7G3ZHE5_9SACH|nr:uncharacterized protein HG536_0D04530 [Torulaspora globosa]QLL32931.1 hypothetical protein HG536_0D04530 [Torulaspora globosa]